MTKTKSTLIATVAALTLSGGAYAQNNTLATPSVRSPAAPTSSYGTPGVTNSDSGPRAVSANSSQQTSTTNSSTSATAAFGGNNTLATPTTASPGK